MDLILLTRRLLLRPWDERDAADLFLYARDPAVGPIAGWAPHSDEADSRHIIRTVLSAPETYAMVLRATGQPIGSVGILFDKAGSPPMAADEGEIGYWVGVPFWGHGYTPEAVRRLQKHAFETLSLRALWCGYYDGNRRSCRAGEKCGFLYHHTERDKVTPLNDIRTEHFTCLTREQWQESPLCRADLGTIACAEAQDLDEILALQRLAYQSEAELLQNHQIPPLTQTICEVRTEFETGLFLKQTDEIGAIIGSVRAYSDGETVRIGKLMVHPAHRGKGYGTQLLRTIEQAYPHRRYELFTSAHSAANLRLYTRLGYKPFRESGTAIPMIYLEKE